MSIKKLAMMQMMSAMAMMCNEAPRGRYYEEKESLPEKQKRLSKAEEDRKIKNGLSKFWYGQNFVWARDQKNADRKAKNNNWLK